MLVEAIYEDGKILFPQKLNFAHNRFAIKVDVPEEEILAVAGYERNLSPLGPQTVGTSHSQPAVVATYLPASAENMPDDYVEFRKLRDSLFGSDYVYVQEKSDQEILLEVLSEKYA